MSLTWRTAVAVGAAALPLLSILGAPASAFASASPPAHGPAGGRLAVTVDDGAGRVTSYELRCGPDGDARGSYPDPKAACERLRRLGGPLGPVPEGRMCPMIYGGPQTAHITGVWRAAAVQERYSRTNGCETERWRAMEPVLPGPSPKA